MELDSNGIDKMPNKPEEEIDKILISISKELKDLSKKKESKGIKNHHEEARAEINKKYGKWWRERLQEKKIYNGSPFKQ